jgi:phenylalanyl-tRNA synthetase alpha chain
MDLIIPNAKEALHGVQTRPQWEAVKSAFLGPNGALTACLKEMPKLDPAERPAFGKAVNAIKVELEAIFSGSLEAIVNKELQAKIGPAIDPTLPSPLPHLGAKHPLTQVRERVYTIFKRLGFTIADGPQLESAWACFDALNVPSDHPSRAEQDTYYFSEKTPLGTPFTPKEAESPKLLRTQTSTIQIRTLLAEKLPLKIVAGGRCFRRDTTDATHSSNFHQIEGLCVDENLSVQDLKATLDYFLKSLFGENIKIRLRSSFFPFTEPSFEVDLMSPDLGKLSNQWIEILGCGRVHPNVLANVGIDPKRYSGFAMGMGIERLAMLLYKVDDIRYFYQNDYRFLSALNA